jgi:prolyl-tRNA synthetase
MNKPSSSQSAISPARNIDFPEWYQEVVKQSDLAENSSVRGCMVIKPWGYGIWENIQRILDEKIKHTGHENAYFPLFIPVSFLEKEVKHVEGFAKECAVVTHHRLESNNGKLIPTGALEEPLIVRPTSETIIGESFSRWVQSYRDLPLLINQWANVVRWEMRTRIFLRTSEFLWQEGHTCHADEKEALEETILIHKLYQDFIQNVLAIPGIPGEKPFFDRFPGAERSFSVEAMMQDGKALQASTSHYLGQNFAKACDIQFLNREGVKEYVHTTSWGCSTRLIGGLIMTHGDDDGLRVPPMVAPKHIVILPVIPKPDMESQVMQYSKKIKERLSGLHFRNVNIYTHIDTRDIRGGDKNWQWIKKGIPLRIEAGPRDIEKNVVCVYRRDKPHKERIEIPLETVPKVIPELLEEIQNNYFSDATKFRDSMITDGLTSSDDLEQFFTSQETKKGFVLGKWSGTEKGQELLSSLKISIRNIPDKQSGTAGKCLLSGQDAVKDVLYARSY